MRIFNTLSAKKEEFIPITEGKVKFYACGPTVYNFIHVGNARFSIITDTMRRYLEYKGYEVTFVQNFTDVDDKIIKRANDEGVSMQAISRRYIDEVMTDMRGLNIKDATYYPRVTQEMPEIIRLIEQIIENGHAYVPEGGGSVFFDTVSYDEYGKLSHKNIEELLAGARIEVDETKKHPTDFVLWKPSKPGEPYWESPWGNGRPGWHVECSAMIKKYLGDTIDIHAGGEDLIFPHHENELAQSECGNKTAFVHYWTHVAHMNMDNKKMSKSAGNFYTLREISDKYGYELVRFYILSIHYRNPMNFNVGILESAKNGLDRIYNALQNLSHIIENSYGRDDIAESETLLFEAVIVYRNEFLEAMDDDFNTADAISKVFELVKFANINVSDGSSAAFAELVRSEILSLMDILGFDMENQSTGSEDEKILEMIEQRAEARRQKNWIEADRLRDKLKELGVIIEDTAQGTTRVKG